MINCLKRIISRNTGIHSVNGFRDPSGDILLVWKGAPVEQMDIIVGLEGDKKSLQYMIHNDYAVTPIFNNRYKIKAESNQHVSVDIIEGRWSHSQNRFIQKIDKGYFTFQPIEK